MITRKVKEKGLNIEDKSSQQKMVKYNTTQV